MCLCMYSAQILPSYNYFPLCVLYLFSMYLAFKSATNKILHFDIFCTALNRQ